MDSERESPGLTIRTVILAFALFDRIRQVFEGAQSLIHRSGDGGGKVTRDPVAREQVLNRRQRVGDVVHDVVSGAAMNVNIYVTRRHHALAEIGNRNSGGKLAAVPSGNFEDASVLDEHDRMLDGTGGSQKPSSSKSQHRNVLIRVKGR